MRLLISAVLALIFTPTIAFAQDVSGLWQTEPGDTGGFLHVAIGPCGDNICGTIRTAFDGDRSVISDYEHQGKQLIWDMAADGANAWKSGKIWAPDRDKT